MPNPTHFLHHSNTIEDIFRDYLLYGRHPTDRTYYLGPQPLTLQFIDPYINSSRLGELHTWSDDGDLYSGCGACSYYSFIFSSPTIKTEEDFEKHKEKFVTHMNDKHKDEIKKKLEKPKTNKKFTKVKESYLMPSCVIPDRAVYREINGHLVRLGEGHSW